jgi:hypothetical protein
MHKGTIAILALSLVLLTAPACNKKVTMAPPPLPPAPAKEARSTPANSEAARHLGFPRRTRHD